jgi:hypothetical protein
LNSLWCTKLRKLYTQPSLISREVKALLMEAGINRHFPAYSASHALIMFLLWVGFSEVEVYAYYGHSNNFHTAISHCFHLDGNWAGKRIVQEALKEVPEKAEGIIEDNRLQREEEGKEPEMAAESDAAGRGREELARFDWECEQSTEGTEPASKRQATGGRKEKEGKATSQGTERAGSSDRILDGLGRGSG